MNIDLSNLDFSFQARPLLIGGKAMEYYGLRQAGSDIDFVITPPTTSACLKNTRTTCAICGGAAAGRAPRTIPG